MLGLGLWLCKRQSPKNLQISNSLVSWKTAVRRFRVLGWLDLHKSFPYALVAFTNFWTTSFVNSWSKMSRGLEFSSILILKSASLLKNENSGIHFVFSSQFSSFLLLVLNYPNLRSFGLYQFQPRLRRLLHWLFRTHLRLDYSLDLHQIHHHQKRDHVLVN